MNEIARGVLLDCGVPMDLDEENTRDGAEGMLDFLDENGMLNETAAMEYALKTMDGRIRDLRTRIQQQSGGLNAMRRELEQWKTSKSSSDALREAYNANMRELTEAQDALEKQRRALEEMAGRLEAQETDAQERQSALVDQVKELSGKLDREYQEKKRLERQLADVSASPFDGR